MSFQLSEYLQSPFILVTDRLVVVPTPIAIRYNAYIHLYGSLHASEAFCQMAFGPHFLARKWSDEETKDVVLTRDLGRCWKQRGMGDFAVGLRTGVVAGDSGRRLEGEENVRIVEGGDLDLNLDLLRNVEWMGYAGVRDATTTSMPSREPGDEPLPHWQEMVELRYGVHEKGWGKGIAGEAARAVMQWAVTERGVRRFLAETEKTNVRSGKVLQKMGFRESGTNYWKEPSEIEWERVLV
jgi:RimJ/RimL family protein N-acetyltransferase